MVKPVKRLLLHLFSTWVRIGPAQENDLFDTKRKSFWDLKVPSSQRMPVVHKIYDVTGPPASFPFQRTTLHIYSWLVVSTLTIKTTNVQTPLQMRVGSPSVSPHLVQVAKASVSAVGAQPITSTTFFPFKSDAPVILAATG